MNDIEALSEWLRSLQITEEASNDYEQMDTHISKVPAPVAVSKNIQVEMPKNMILDPEWFDSD